MTSVLKAVASLAVNLVAIAILMTARGAWEASSPGPPRPAPPRPAPPDRHDAMVNVRATPGPPN